MANELGTKSREVARILTALRIDKYIKYYIKRWEYIEKDRKKNARAIGFNDVEPLIKQAYFDGFYRGLVSGQKSYAIKDNNLYVVEKKIIQPLVRDTIFKKIAGEVDGLGY